MRESIKVEAEVDVPGLQGIELVLDAVERAGPCHVASPLGEKQVRGWKGGCTWPKAEVDKGSVAVRDTSAAFAAGFSKSSPDVGGCEC